MTDNPFASLGVSPVINAAGKMTHLGGTAQTDATASAQSAAAGLHVDMAALRRAAGELIAVRTGAEAASITNGAASGIAIAVAACITGTDRALIERIPHPPGGPRPVLLQPEHDVFFGAHVRQMIAIGGGQPRFDTRFEGCAAALYVQSHHTQNTTDKQTPALSLDEFISRAHAADVPVIVDAAAEEDLRRYIASGADLVAYSGGKAIGGPTSGFICGGKDLVRACEAQQVGIARAMKVSKEAIAGLIAALSDYPASADNKRAHVIHEALQSSAMDVFIKPDEAGRPIERVAIRAGARAKELVDFLENGTPPIYTRNHQVGEGLVLIDTRELGPDSNVDLLVARVLAFN